jgi:hypothetical protein
MRCEYVSTSEYLPVRTRMSASLGAVPVPVRARLIVTRVPVVPPLYCGVSTKISASDSRCKWSATSTRPDANMRHAVMHRAASDMQHATCIVQQLQVLQYVNTVTTGTQGYSGVLRGTEGTQGYSGKLRGSEGYSGTCRCTGSSWPGWVRNPVHQPLHDLYTLRLVRT